MAITLRTQKGSELTFQELDNNFSDLNGRVTTLEGSGGSSKIELTDLSVTTNSASGNGTLTYNNVTGVFAYTPPDLSSFATSALENVVEDTTPQLGGDLDVNGKIITAASLNVSLNPPAGGFLHLGLGTADAHSVMMYDMYKFPKASPSTGDVLTAGANPIELEWAAPSGGSATNMASLTDVDSVDTVASGDFLLYDGSSTEYKFVAFEAEVNGLIDSRTGGSGHVSTQSQYTTKVTTDPADPTDTAHHVLSNTGTPSIQGASTAWYYGDVISDPANPTTSVVLDIDSAILTGDVMGDITSNGTSTFNGTVDFSATSSIDFTGASVSGLSGSTWATLGDKDGANGPAGITLGRNAVGNGTYNVSIGNAAISNNYGVAIGMETQAATYDVNVGSFSGKNHVVTDHGYRIAIGAFAQQNANPGDETGVGAIAIGTLAGDANQGANSVAIGRYAGRNNQAAQSIVINATNADLENLTPDSFVVKPIRQEAQPQALYYNPATGEVTYEAAGGGGGGSGLQSRSTKTGTTSSLADAAQADLDITGFKSYALLTITTDRAARVRLYVSAATRTADASRAEGVDPTSDAGLIAEVITTGAETVIISPGAYGFNLEGTPTTTIPCRVTNKSGGTSTVQVDLNILQLEA